MDISLVPDTYTPSIDDNGNYIDGRPQMMNGISCLCGSRRQKVYETQTKFSTHCKTKIHQKWLQQLNHNKANYYIELQQMKDIHESQKQIIARLENEVSNKSRTIDYLTHQLCTDKIQHRPDVDLLDIN
jgi:hypothetical protein